MFGGDEDHVVRAFVGDRHVRHIERLGIDLSINRVKEQSAEAVAVDVGRSERGFVKVLTSARVVIVVSQHIDLSGSLGRQSARQNAGDRQKTNQ